MNAVHACNQNGCVMKTNDSPNSQPTGKVAEQIQRMLAERERILSRLQELDSKELSMSVQLLYSPVALTISA